jgi:hypothetical protein
MFEGFAKYGFVTVAGKNVKVRAIECEKQSKECLRANLSKATRHFC